MGRFDPAKVAPFFFEGGPVGCLLIHGFTGSPPVMRELGEHLAERGLTVSCNTLPGHGTTPEDMSRTNWHDWHRACVTNLAEFSARCSTVFLCGLSMGGTLSLHLAAHYANRYNVAGVAAYGAPLYMKHPLLPLLPIGRHFMKFMGTPPPDVADLSAQDRVQSYDRVPLDCFASLLDLLAHVKNDVPDINVPAILFHGKDDHTVEFANVRLIHELLGSTDKTVVELERSYHCVTVDYEKDVVQQKTYEFIQRIAGI
jgi:carboxylesterase